MNAQPAVAGPGDGTARLRTAPFEVVGRFADASNATLLVRLTDHDPRPLDQLQDELGRAPTIDDLDPGDLAVYKPVRGEAPLWDFPVGTLHRREVAAYEISCALGWELVPETVVREDGPFGAGSVQRFVSHDPDQHYFSLLESGDPDIVAQLLAMVVFDLVIDNADRKGGHVLLEVGDEAPGRIRLVDHGVSLHVERKLRTVAWEFAGDPVPARLCEDLVGLRAGLDDAVAARLDALLLEAEIDALRDRVDEVVRLRELPAPLGPRAYPWPLL